MSDLSIFLGRLHPVLVHLPIGLLVAAGAFQAWVSWQRRRQAASNLDAAIGPLLWLSAIGAATAAGAGYLLGTSGGYGGSVFDWHQWMGLGVAALALGTAGARRHASHHPDRNAQVTYGFLLLSTLGLVVAASHAGATLTHGEGYLTEHAPPTLKALIAFLEPPPAAPEDDGPIQHVVVFEALIDPIFKSRCISCHGDERSEGGLRLDGPDGIGEGGDHGAIVAPERPASSEVWRRVSLPPDHPDVMPPSGHSAVTAAEGALLRWWIEGGASFEKTLGELDVTPVARSIVEATLGPLPAGGPTLPPVSPDEADPQALAAAEAAGFSVKPIAVGIAFVQVQTTNASSPIGDTEVATLVALAPQILWLDLGGTQVTDAGLESVGRLPHVVRLDLSRTVVSSAGLAHLGDLEYLESLNLYGTQVADEGLEHLESVATLRSLYLWQTATTPAGAERLSVVLPDLEVVTGGDLGGEGGASP